jgi:hypothetical protein
MRHALPIVVLAACGGGGTHRHGPASHADDMRRLYVEVAAKRTALRTGAARGLANIGFVVPVDEGGDVELQVEASRLEVSGGRTSCGVKILVLRLPQHDLLGIADGNAHVAATGDGAKAECLEHLGSTLVRGKVRGLLQRRLAAKR